MKKIRCAHVLTLPFLLASSAIAGPTKPVAKKSPVVGAKAQTPANNAKSKSERESIEKKIADLQKELQSLRSIGDDLSSKLADEKNKQLMPNPADPYSMGAFSINQDNIKNYERDIAGNDREIKSVNQKIDEWRNKLKAVGKDAVGAKADNINSSSKYVFGVLDEDRLAEKYSAYQAELSDVKRTVDAEDVRLKSMIERSDDQEYIAKIRQRIKKNQEKIDEVDAKYLQISSEVVNDIASTTGFLVIFRKKALVTSSNAHDITDQVIKRLNAK